MLPISKLAGILSQGNTPSFATTATLSGGTSSGTTNSPMTVTVTLNGAVPSGGYTATLARSGVAGSLANSSLVFTFGGATSLSTTNTNTADGASSVTMTGVGLTLAGTPQSYTSSTSVVVSTGTPQPFTLTSSASGSLPFAIGYPMSQGHVPSGQSLTFSGATAKLQILSTWPDGSARHGIIAGTYTSAGSAVTVAPTVGSASIGTPLTGASVQSAMASNTAAFDAGAFGSATFSGSDFASPFMTHFATDAAGEFIYRKQIGSDAHLVAWIAVRLWSSGAVEVLPWVENAYIDSTSVTNKSATYTFTLGGTSRFSQVVDVKHRTRPLLVTGATLSYWLGTDPAVTPKHDTAYLQQTGLAPSYMWDAPSTGTLNGLQQTYTPNTLAGISSSMGVAGSSAALIPNSAALYLTSSGDSRAWAAMQVFGYSGGSWSTHYRDSATNYPFKFTDWPNASYEGQPVPTGATGGENGIAVTTHQPSYGYLPALLTGRWWFVEESEFWCGYNYLRSRVNARRGETSYENAPFLFAGGSSGVIDCRTGAYANRGAHWGIRTLAQTLALVPLTHPNYASYLAAWENNTDFYHRAYVLGTHAPGWVSPQGFLGDYSADGNTAYGIDTVSWWGAAWMSTFGVQAWGFASDIGLPQSSGSLARHTAVRDQAYKQVTQRSGTDYNWRRFGVFSYPIGSDSTGLPPNVWYTAAQSYAALLSGFSLSSIGSTVGSTLKAHSSDTDLASGTSTANDYLPMGLSALAYAFKHNASGAMDGWHRVTTASNFNAIAGLRQGPEHGIGPQLPAWVPPPGRFANISASTLQSVRPAGWPTSGDIAGPFSNWSSGFYARNLGNKGSYVVHGSGHLSTGTPLWAGIWCFDLESLTWVGRNVPPAPLLEGSDYNTFGESTVTATLGHAYPQHSYDGLVYQPAANGGGVNGSMWRVQAAGQTYTHKFDLSSASAPPTRPFSVQPGGNGYSMAALDEGRNGFWTLNNNGSGTLRFVSFVDDSSTMFPTAGYNVYGDNSLIYLPPPYDALVGMGRANADNTLWKAWVCQLGGVSPSFVEITANTTGTPVGDGRSGGCWSTLLNCIVSYQAAGSYTVHKLTPPAVGSNLGTAAWAWTTETLTGVASATPAQSSASANGAWSRLIEIPWARCFVWADSVNQPTQAWRLTGM